MSLLNRSCTRGAIAALSLRFPIRRGPPAPPAPGAQAACLLSGPLAIVPGLRLRPGNRSLALLAIPLVLAGLVRPGADPSRLLAIRADQPHVRDVQRRF